LIERQIIQEVDPSQQAKIPTITTWKGVKMIRVHSFLASVHEIIKYIEKLDYVKLGIIGNQNTGKTTLAKDIGHAIHKLAEKELGLTFQVKVFTRKELLNFSTTLANLTPANYIMIFDDISFLHEATPKQLMEIKSAVTMIRHMKGGQDVKIVEIDDYHYTKGHDKYLRQSHFKYYTSIGSEEVQNVASMTNPKFVNRIGKFQQMQSNLLNTGYFKITLQRGKPPFVYKYRDPFIPNLFWNGNNLRLVVTPTWEWMDRQCAICAVAGGNKTTDFDLGKFKKLFDEKHRESIAKIVIRLKMFSLGLNTYKPTVMRALYELNKTMQEANFDIKELANMYGLEPSKPTFTRDFARLLQSSQKEIEKVDSENEKDDPEEKSQEHLSIRPQGSIVEW
jgi:molybdopterin-guanine dinucleotide biosynthesis protein